MKKYLTIAELTEDVSGKLLDSINLLEILEDVTDGEVKEDTLIRMTKSKLKSAFHNIEKCRKMVCIPD